MQHGSHWRCLRSANQEFFITSPSPGQIARFLQNQYDADEEAYLYVLADVMKAQNYAIEEAGFVLQLDRPDLARSRHAIFAHVPLEEFRQIIAMYLRRSTMP
jgi:5-methyltetrahydropteroyltriglutamate--homocysteine methyltransferase